MNSDGFDDAVPLVVDRQVDGGPQIVVGGLEETLPRFEESPKPSQAMTSYGVCSVM